jgi:uncharacterized membrane protein
MKNEIFNLTNSLSLDLPSVFIKIFSFILILYVLLLIYDFLREKYILKETSENKNNKLHTLLTLISKLFIISGYGFILLNIIHVILSELTHRSEINWNNLAFGILILFMGIGFNKGLKTIIKNNS